MSGLYEQYMRQLEIRKAVSQTLLYPEELKLDPLQRANLSEMMEDLNALGFQINLMENEYYVVAVPENIDGIEPGVLVLDLIEGALDHQTDIPGERREKLSLQLSKSAAIPYGQILSDTERKDLIEKLFAASEQKYTPDGKKIRIRLTEEELRKRFQQL